MTSTLRGGKEMITIVGSAVVGGMVAFFLNRRSSHPTGVEWVLFFGLALGALIGAFSGVMLSLAWDATSPTEWLVASQHKLVAMKTSDTLEGSFFLASGGFEGKRYYLYYTETVDGGYKAHRIDAEDKNVIVYEDREEGGTLLVKDLTPIRKSGWLRYFALGSSCTCERRYEFHIPEGSLVQKFRLE